MFNFIKTFILIIWILFGQLCFSQELFLYRDTTYNFSIEIPKDWKFQAGNDPKTSIKLFVLRSKDTETENPRETFNVNILKFGNADIDLCYSQMIQSISTRTGYKLISEGDTTIDGKKYKWLIEQHANTITNEAMTAYIYLGYKSPFAYMATFATTTIAFEKYAELFRRIASTFTL